MRTSVFSASAAPINRPSSLSREKPTCSGWTAGARRIAFPGDPLPRVLRHNPLSTDHRRLLERQGTGLHTRNRNAKASMSPQAIPLVLRTEVMDRASLLSTRHVGTGSSSRRIRTRMAGRGHHGHQGRVIEMDDVRIAGARIASHPGFEDEVDIPPFLIHGDGFTCEPAPSGTPAYCALDARVSS